MDRRVLDLPYPLEPVEIDMDVPLEEQLAGRYLEAARTMLDMLNKYSNMRKRLQDDDSVRIAARENTKRHGPAKD